MQRIFSLLGLAPDASGDDISAAYWSRARVLRAADETGALAELDDLNAAYQTYTRELARRPPRSARLPRRRYWKAALVALCVLGVAVGASIYRDVVADAGAGGTARAQDVGAQAVDWLRTRFATPTPGARFLLVGRTNGEGAYLRVAPGYAAAPAAAALPDGTGVAVLGQRASVDGETWQRVRAAGGAEGWISERWLARP
ncbi:MAG: J domain-containing protein [Dehalococcoidia bacterium]|nr:J domain-containing protein [Dehalococcoidia bacterium]